MDDEEFDFTKYELGDHVDVFDDGKWHNGIIVRIDEADPSLPWGATLTVPSDKKLDGFRDSDGDVNWYWYKAGEEFGWGWYRDDQIRPTHYVDKNFVIQEDTLIDKPR